jgi:uncharacterized protein YwqG
MKPTIRIRTQKGTKTSHSFFGGLPMVPSHFTWPVWDATPYYLDEIQYAEENYREYRTKYWKSRIKEDQKKLKNPQVPLMFLGQIHLEEVPRYGDFPCLPSSGILYFFWDLFHYPPGWRVSSKGACKVVYVSNISELQTLSPPRGLIARLEIDIENQCGLSFEAGWISAKYTDTMIAFEESMDEDEDAEHCNNAIPPSFLTEALEEIPQDFPERDDSSIVIKDHPTVGESVHLLFGSPIEIQNPMEAMCQLCFHGFNALEYNIRSDQEVAHLKEGVKDWQLLLQLDSDDNLDWMWGDAGVIYFWIRKQDLEKQDFSNVWCEMQCS